VQSLAPNQIARATTLLGINDQLGGAIGAALMAVLLTNQLGHPDGAGAPHLAHAYAVVFVVAAALAACTIIPAAFLPKKPVGQAPEG
jgi:MFS transporter, DHA2 family, multidrug resistance protein